MLEAYIRPSVQQHFISPLAEKVCHWISPNVCTFFAVIVGSLSGVCIAFNKPWWGVALLILSGLLDVLDGSLARVTQQQSDAGSALDIVGDRVVEISVVLGLYALAPMERGMLSLWILGSILLCMTTFLVVGIFAHNQSDKSFHYSPGLIERFEAFLFFILMILLPSVFSLLGSLFVILVLITCVIRLTQFVRQA